MTRALRSLVLVSVGVATLCFLGCARDDRNGGAVVPAREVTLPSDAAPSDAAPADAAPNDAGSPVTASEVRAWFVLTHRKCSDTNVGYGVCYAVSIALRGAINEDRVLQKEMWSQLGCEGGASILCDGPSGSSHYSVRCDAKGACTVESRSESDGYCPENDCASVDVLTRFDLPAGTKLRFAKP